MKIYLINYHVKHQSTQYTVKGGPHLKNINVDGKWGPTP
jgi:hypothetical protein